MLTKIFVIICAALASACALVAITATREHYDNFRQNPCVAPCWYGLVPGKSTREDAWNVLPGLPFIVPWTTAEGLVNRSNHDISWRKKWNLSIRDWIEIDSNDVVLGIVVQPDAPLSLGEVIQTMGIPAKIELYNVGAELSRIRLELFYPGQGFVCEVIVSEGGAFSPSYEIKPDMPVARVEYRIADASPDHLIFWNSWRTNYRVSLGQMQDWPGFGSVRPNP
jgi:hypothetical protein